MMLGVGGQKKIGLYESDKYYSKELNIFLGK